MAKMPLEVMNLFNDQTTVKVVATVDKSRKPNAVIIGSCAAMDDQTLLFADMFIGKTKQNIEQQPKVAVTVMRPPMEAYQVHGTFTNWVTSGPIFDMMAEAIYEQMPLAIKGLGLISIDAVYSLSPTSGKPGELMA